MEEKYRFRGRPLKQKHQYLEDYHIHIVMMSKGHSLREISRITQTSTTTLLKVKKMFL